MRFLNDLQRADREYDRLTQPQDDEEEEEEECLHVEHTEITYHKKRKW